MGHMPKLSTNKPFKKKKKKKKTANPQISG